MEKKKTEFNTILDEYKKFISDHSELVPEFEYISLPAKENRFQYVGGQIFDGSLYAVVNSAKRMLKHDIKNGSFEFIGDFSDRDFKWTGGCEYKGIIYFFPRSENCLLMFDPQTGIFTRESGDCDYQAEHHYGGVCTNDGIIYQPPRNTDHILKWDLEKHTCNRIYINNAHKCRYCGSVIHPNGYIYFLPERGLPVVKMNIMTESIEYIYGPADMMVFNPVVAADGNIYGFSTSKGIVKIDTQSDTVSLLFENCSTGAYGTKCGINGKLYSIPGYKGDVWSFDPYSNQLEKCFTIDRPDEIYYAGGAVDTNGDIYALPVFSDNIFKISFGRYKVDIPQDLYNRFFKDFY